MTKKKIKIHDEIAAALKNGRHILISAHRDPDGDSLGSLLAMARYLKGQNRKYVILCDGEVPYKYEFLPGIKDIIHPQGVKIENGFDVAVILDSSNRERIGDSAGWIGTDTTVINIDHHPDNSKFGKYNLVNDRASSTGELITEFFLDIGWKMDAETATALYAAMLTDTGRFRYESAGPRTMELAGTLLTYGINARRICDSIYYSIPPHILKLTGELVSRMDFYEDDRICLMGADLAILQKHQIRPGDMEGLAEFTLYGRNTLVGGLLKELPEGGTKISLRSRFDFDVSRLAQKYGGGGHINASGCFMDLPLAQSHQKLLRELKELIHGKI